MNFTKIILLSVLILILNLNKFANAEIKSKIIAKIGGEIITNFDVENKIRTNLFLAGEEINQFNVDKIKSFALKSLVNLKLKKNEIKKYELKTNSQAIDQHLTQITNNLKINKAELINRFQIYDINYDQFLEDINTEFLWQSLIAKIYIDRIQINEEQINIELMNILKNKKNKIEVNLSEIEITYENSEDQIKVLNEINDSIKNIGFEKTAIKFSASTTALNGGKLGWINLEQLSPEISKIIKNLQVGEVSPPIKKANVITFLQLIKKRNSPIQNVLNKDKLKIALENNKKNELLNLYSNSHLSKIKNTTLIEFQ